jgi:hypothetical protein
MAYKYTYIVECRTPAVHVNEREAYNGDIWHVTYYVGGTNNPRQRIEAHLAGKGAKYLRGREILRVIICPTSDLYNEHGIKHGEWWWEGRDWMWIPAWSREKKGKIMESAFENAKHQYWPTSMVSLQFWRPFWHRTTEGGVFD